MCKVSIIMPVYNKEKYVAKSIKSVLNQTLSNWELVIVDDGSTDESYEICSRFKDSRIIVIRTDNGGVSKARNIGLRMARGEYVTFLDGDDTISECYLEKLLVDGCQMVISGLKRKNCIGEISGEVLPFYDGEYLMSQIGKKFYEHELKNGIYGFVAGKLIKREIIEKNKICFDESIRLAEDYDFFVKVYQYVNEIYFIQKSYYFYLDENDKEFNVKLIDIPSQIVIQMRTREWLMKMDSFSVHDEDAMKIKIGMLIYTYLLECSSMRFEMFKHHLETLREIPISIQYGVKSLSGKLMLYIFRMKKDCLLYFLLWIHRMIRK